MTLSGGGGSTLEVLRSNNNQHQLATVFLMMIMLTVDSVNPLKAIAHALGKCM